LDEAILGNLGNGGSDSGGGGGNPEGDSRKIADLLKHGAHCLHAMEAANEQVWVVRLGGSLLDMVRGHALSCLPILPDPSLCPLWLQGGEFVAEGIDQILQGRTEKRQIGGRAGNTFSVATFAVGGAGEVRCLGACLHVRCMLVCVPPWIFVWGAVLENVYCWSTC
jgi:hypothetical protein